MHRFLRTLMVLSIVLAATFATGAELTVAATRHPCSARDGKATVSVVEAFSRALIRGDIAAVNRLITPALRTRARSMPVRGADSARREQASLSFLLVGPDHNGTPTRPRSFRLLPAMPDCYGGRPLRATITLFYRWPGEALSNIGLVKTTAVWRINSLRLAQA